MEAGVGRPAKFVDKMKILVTGALGFIGSHLVDRLVDEGHSVLGIDDLSGGSRNNINKKVWYWHFDIRDETPTKTLIDSFKPEAVFHLAANAAENKSQFSPIDISTRNYNTFLNVVTPAINNGVKRFILASSIAVYGEGSPPFKETDDPKPEDIYGISKLAAEQTLKVLAKVHDFEYVVARMHNVYGPRQNMSDPYRNVVTIFMNSLLKREPYYIFGDGEQRRCFTYVADVVDALYKCLDAGVANMTFNIGSDKDYSVNELSETIQDVALSNQTPIYLSDRPQEVKFAAVDHALSKKHLQYKDRTSLKEGLEKTWEWCKNMGYQQPIYTELEITKSTDKVPENWKK